jgi:hypothetical protein
MSNARYGFRTFTTGEVRTLARKGVLPFVEAGFFSDIFGVPDVAFSVRKLTPTATNCIRVRRSNDNAEQDIGFVSNTADSLIDTSALLSFVGSGNDGFVTTLYNQGNNGNDFTNTNGSTQARIVDGGSLVVDSEGFPAVQWVKARLDKFTNSSLTNVANFSSYRVVETSDTTYVTFGDGSFKWNWAADQNSASSSDGADYGTGTLFIDGVQYTGTTRAQLYTAQNGRRVISDRTVGKSNWSQFDVGGHGFGFAFSGKMTELIFYFTDNFSSSRVGIETNMNDLYDVF